MGRKVLAVDFDGTLCQNNYPKIGRPKLRVINLVKRFKKQYKWTIILWTCRKDKELSAAVRWCEKYELVFDYVNENTKENIESFGGVDTRKVYADLYIDDKAIGINDLFGIKNKKK